MDEYLEKLFSQTRKFEEGELYQEEEYRELARIQFRHYSTLYALLGPRFEHELTEFFASLGDEWRLECKHFFLEGYRMGLKDGNGKAT